MSSEDCLMTKGMATTFDLTETARHEIYILHDPLAGWESRGSRKGKGNRNCTKLRLIQR